MAIFHSIGGKIRLRLISADMAGILRYIVDENVSVQDFCSVDELTAIMTVSAKDAKIVERICTDRGAVAHTVERVGLYWKIARLTKRRILIIGLMLIMLFAIWLPGRIWFVEVEGNAEIPQHQIREIAADHGIRFGASRRKVRSEQMKNSILSALPQLQWAGVNTYGCRAVITVREKPKEEEISQGNSVSSIIAAMDGVISECTVTKGSPLCEPGQAVTKGQVLISGFTDCGICIRATRADGEIMALTNRELTLATPSECNVRLSEGQRQVFFSLVLGKKRINFYKGSGISGGSCVKMYSKYVLTLPGGFELPVMLIRESVKPAKTEKIQIPDRSQMLRYFAHDYLTGQMIAGQILREEVQILEKDGVFLLIGKFACRESIGARQEEKVGEHNG